VSPLAKRGPGYEPGPLCCAPALTAQLTTPVAFWATVEAELLQEQDEIEFALGADYLDRRNE
jgi:hypothetical protein